MHSSNHHILLVSCSVFLLGSLCSSREVPMRHEQTVQSQEQATRTTIDSNEVSIGTTLTGWQRF
jgi:hypothetical protein